MRDGKVRLSKNWQRLVFVLVFFGMGLIAGNWW
jgi:hypothetical protein